MKEVAGHGAENIDGSTPGDECRLTGTAYPANYKGSARILYETVAGNTQIRITS